MITVTGQYIALAKKLQQKIDKWNISQYRKQDDFQATDESISELIRVLDEVKQYVENTEVI